MAQLQFNANEFDPSQMAGQLPIGRHPVVIASSEIKPTNDNSSGYLQLDLQIIDGPNKGEVGAYRLNIYNQSEQAKAIAQKQLSAVCHVTGVFVVNDTTQLHGKPFIVEVGPQKTKPEYTEVKKVLDINGDEPGKAGQTQPAAPAAPPAAAATQPPAAQPWQPPAAPAAPAATSPPWAAK